MLGFFPLGAYELESPTLAEFKQNAYILGAVTLAGLALSGGKPPSYAAELAAEPTAAFSAASPALHLESAALYASPTALSMLADAALHRAPTMHAAADAATASQASRLLLPTPRVRASASASIDAGAVYTVHLPRALAASSEAEFSVPPVYTVQLPRALAAAADAATSADANIKPTPNFVASGVVDLALVDANLRRSALFEADGVVNVLGSGYLNRAAHMHSDSSMAVAGAVPKIDLERWLAAAASSGTVVSGTLGVPATMLASPSVLTSASANAVLLPQLFPAPERLHRAQDFSTPTYIAPERVWYDVVVLSVPTYAGTVPLSASETYIIEKTAQAAQSIVNDPRLAVVSEELVDKVTEDV
jgi:hypothetical protein